MGGGAQGWKILPVCQNITTPETCAEADEMNHKNLEAEKLQFPEVDSKTRYRPLRKLIKIRGWPRLSNTAHTTACFSATSFLC